MISERLPANTLLRWFRIGLVGLFILSEAAWTSRAETPTPTNSVAPEPMATVPSNATEEAVKPVTKSEPEPIEPRKSDEDASAVLTAQNFLDWIPAEKVSSSLHLAISMTLLGLVPALLLMTTCYVRISVVLALLRQAFGIPNLLPMQATTALALFCTGWIMWPTWQLVHRQAIVPMVAGQSVTDPEQLWLQGIGPIRDFMVRQIEANHNTDDVHLFLQKTASESSYPTSYDEVPLAALLPAFLLSELKTAFIIGFKIYLPFLVIDLVVSAITTSMGLFMMPPSMLSMPLKLLLFVLVDGWHVVVEMLLTSFQ